MTRYNRGYWRWGWLGPFVTWNAGLIYPWRLGLGPIQLRGETGNAERLRLVDKRRKAAIEKAEEAVGLLAAVNKIAAERLRGAVNDTKRLWEIS